MKSPHHKKKALKDLSFYWSAEMFPEAKQLLDDLVEEYPRDAVLWRDLSSVQMQLKDYAGTVEAAKNALALRPHDTISLLNHANALLMLGRHNEAIESYAAAARSEPSNFFARLFYAGALSYMGREEESLTEINAALTLQPGHAEALWSRANTLLRLGRFKEGWSDLEARWKRGILQEKVYSSSRWEGEDLAGKTILVNEEQGYGDTILFSRYLPLLKKRGARVLFECRPELHRLFEGMVGIDRIVRAEAIDEKFDYYIPVMSLPRLFSTELGSIPLPSSLPLVAALSADAEERLAAGQNRYKVGIVWSGNTKFTTNQMRAVEMNRFLPLANIPNVQLYSLQKGDPARELENAPPGTIIDLAPVMKDFADTAAILCKLDLIIMTDSAVAHLAGTLGCPVWNLISNQAYWVYLLEGRDCLWYSSMTLFRQPAPGDWDSVFKDVAAQLTKMATAHTISP
jgi:hypothetical protein